MDFSTLRKDHIKLIAWAQVKYSLRGGAGVVFVFFSLVVGLVLAAAFITPYEQLAQQALESADTMMNGFVKEFGQKAVSWIIGGDDSQANYLLFDKPAVVSLLLLSLLIAIPFLVAFGAFNQLSGDIGNRGIRFLLLRTERINLFLGRFLGTFLMELLVFLLLLSVVALYLLAKMEFASNSKMLLWMLQGFFALACLALPYTALCAWISAGVDSPFGSLVLSTLFIGGWPMMVAMGGFAYPPLKYGHYGMPWGFKYWLLHPDLLTFLLAGLAMLGFTGLFLFLGATHLQRRDL